MDHNYKHENVSDASTVTGRFFECSFCRRGFTNAQALGGHMNIHRKEKAKATQEGRLHGTSFSNPFIISDHDNKFESSQAKHNDQLYFNLPTKVPTRRSPYECHQNDSNTVVGRSENLGANLSLVIGPSEDSAEMKNINEKDGNMEHELDLELRLGHDP